MKLATMVGAGKRRRMGRGHYKAAGKRFGFRGNTYDYATTLAEYR